MEPRIEERGIDELRTRVIPVSPAERERGSGAHALDPSLSVSISVYLPHGEKQQTAFFHEHGLLERRLQPGAAHAVLNWVLHRRVRDHDVQYPWRL